ncbi:HIT domain-containing protein [Streptomyces sp. NPDC005953]|uniref:HIT family protein n=1 Tax=unclassified Streptomyces TaxID=2593676 RepID=UPI00340B2549
MAECAFCAIVADPSRARVVHQDAHTLAFFPLAPAVRGHTLVIPRSHAPDLWALDDATAARLTQSVLRVGRALYEVLAPDGMNVINSAGAAASQTVFHVHVHLVPRWPGDAMGSIWPPKANRTPEEHGVDRGLDGLAARIAEVTGSGRP